MEAGVLAGDMDARPLALFRIALGGDVSYQTLQLTGYARPPGAFLAAYPALCKLMTCATLVVELILPVLIVAPFVVGPSRALTIAPHVGLSSCLAAPIAVLAVGHLAVTGMVNLRNPTWVDALLEWRYFFRRFAETEKGSPLVSLTLVRDIHAPGLPGQALSTVRTGLLWKQTCSRRP